MDVKSRFLNGEIKAKVYMEQPLGFEFQMNPTYVFNLNKALYGLKQALKAWYEQLSLFLIKNGFTKGQVDTTLFGKNVNQDSLSFKYMLMTLFSVLRMENYAKTSQ